MKIRFYFEYKKMELDKEKREAIEDQLKNYTRDIMFENGFAYTGEDYNQDGDIILMFGDKDITFNLRGLE